MLNRLLYCHRHQSHTCRLIAFVAGSALGVVIALLVVGAIR